VKGGQARMWAVFDGGGEKSETALLVEREL